MCVSFRTVTEYGMCIGANPLYFFSLPSPRQSSVLRTAGMFQNIFFHSVFFSVQGFTQGTGNTDWWLEYLQMATCTIVSFKSITMHGFIQRQYVLMLLAATQTWTTCQNGNALWLFRMFWRQCSVCVLLLWGRSPLALSFCVKQGYIEWQKMGEHGTVSLRNKHLQKCCLVASTDMTIFMLFILYNTIARSSVGAWLPEVFPGSFFFFC